MQEWQEVEPGRHESESATAELREAPNRLLVTFTGPIDPTEAARLVRSAALDFKLDCPIHIATEGNEQLIEELQSRLKLGPEMNGEVFVLAVPSKLE